MFRQASYWVRTKGNDILESKKLDRYKSLQMTREFLGILNELAGRPFCSQEEIDESLATDSGFVRMSQIETSQDIPVMVYFDDKDHRAMLRVEEILNSQQIKFQVLDVSEDASTRSWALLQSKKESFPLVFIEGESIGGVRELIEQDLNGGLAKRVFGTLKLPPRA